MTASTALAGYLSSVLITSTPSVTFTNDVMNNPSLDAQTFKTTNANAAHRYWDNTVTPVIQAELDEVQQVALTGAPTGGTFTLTFGGNTTTGIAWNASPATVQAALVALASIGAGGVVCTGSNLPTGPVNVEFTSGLGFAAQALMTFSGAGLTGGTSPNVTVTETQHGQGWTTESASLYTVQYVGGTVIFNTPFLGASFGVRAHSGNYFPYATLAQCKNWEVAGTVDSLESSVMVGVGGSPGKTYLPGMFGGTAKLQKFWIDASFLTFLTAGTLLVASLVTPSSNRYEFYCFTKDSSIKADPKSLISENFTFQISGVLATF